MARILGPWTPSSGWWLLPVRPTLTLPNHTLVSVLLVLWAEDAAVYGDGAHPWPEDAVERLVVAARASYPCPTLPHPSHIIAGPVGGRRSRARRWRAPLARGRR